jgi:hypothetical protein
MRHHEVSEIDGARFALRPVQIRDPGERQLLLFEIAKLHDPKPALVVLDTFARCFVGGEENSSKDVGEFVDAAAKIQEVTGGAVLILHHTGKGEGDSARGSSALRASADVMMLLRRTRDALRLTNNKQKDAEEFSPVCLGLEQIALGVHPKTGKTLSSCVVVTGAEAAPVASGMPGRLLDALLQFPGQRARSGEWHGAAGPDIPSTTFDRARKARSCVTAVSSRTAPNIAPQPESAISAGPKSSTTPTPLGWGWWEMVALASGTAGFKSACLVIRGCARSTT